MEAGVTPLAEPINKRDPVRHMRTRLAAEGYKELGTDYEDHPQLDGPRRGSSMERCLMICLALCLLIIICMAVGYIIQYYVLDHQNNPTCQTARCVEISGAIISRMDRTADPCQDFYQYSCGNWLKTTSPPASKGKWSQFTIAQERNDRLMKNILESDGSEFRGVFSSAVWKAKTSYKACMNMSAIEEKGITPILELISSLGSWSLLNDFNENTWDLEAAMVAAFPFANPLFGMGVSTDERNNTYKRIMFDAEGLMYEDATFYTGNKSTLYRAAEVQYFTDMAVMLGAEEATARQLAEDVWELEYQIAEIQTPAEDRVDPTTRYNAMTVEELQLTLGDWINLLSYLRALFDYDIPSTDTVLVYDVQFMQRLNAIVKSTPNRVLAGYVVWLVLPQLHHVMPASFQDANRRWSETLYGTSALKERWATCITATDENMPYVTGGLYVNQTMTQETLDKALEIVQHIIDAFESRLPRLEWMDGKTKKKAMDKLRGLQKFLGGPDFTVKELDERYSQYLVSADAGDAFENLRQSYIYHGKYSLQQLGRLVDKTEWDMSALKVNAYYSASDNKIVITAAILQEVFFDISYPMTMNFGAMGMIIGHELTHGFDNTGRNFDRVGNMNDWWSPASTEGFQDRAQCMIDQYDQYPIGNSHDNGLLTLGENMADNGGLATAYEAYMDWLKNNEFHEDTANLPGLNLTKEQVFFLSFAQVWCVHETESYKQQAIRTDPHTYSPYRVRGTVSNMPEFAEAYNCPAKSPMNPAKKCHVW